MKHLVIILIVLSSLYATSNVQAYSFSLKGLFSKNKPETNNSSRSNGDGWTSTQDDNRLTPVILMPGDGGSRLEAKLESHDVLHKYCHTKSTDWYALWVNLSLLVPFAIDCWIEK